MPLLNLWTNKVSRSRFAKCTVQSVDASVAKGPALDTAGNTRRGAVYSQTKTVRHGMRAAIVGVLVTERCGRVDSVRRGDTNACAAARAATRMRSAIRAVSTRCVSMLAGLYARRFTAAAAAQQCSEMGLLHSCAKRSRSSRAAKNVSLACARSQQVQLWLGRAAI